MASISEAKNNLSALIHGLRSGSPVLIVDRGRPVARLEAVDAGDETDPAGRLSRLVRDGVVRPAAGKVPKAVLASAPPAPRKPASLLQALLEDRRSGR